MFITNLEWISKSKNLRDLTREKMYSIIKEEEETEHVFSIRILIDINLDNDGCIASTFDEEKGLIIGERISHINIFNKDFVNYTLEGRNLGRAILRKMRLSDMLNNIKREYKKRIVEAIGLDEKNMCISELERGYLILIRQEEYKKLNKKNLHENLNIITNLIAESYYLFLNHDFIIGEKGLLLLEEVKKITREMELKNKINSIKKDNLNISNRKKI